MDRSFAYNFDWLHNLYNISILPSKQVIRTKRINPILKWITIALQLTHNETPTPELPISICPRNKT